MVVLFFLGLGVLIMYLPLYSIFHPVVGWLEGAEYRRHPEYFVFKLRAATGPVAIWVLPGKIDVVIKNSVENKSKLQPYGLINYWNGCLVYESATIYAYSDESRRYWVNWIKNQSAT